MKTKLVILCVLVLATGSVFGATKTWTSAAADQDWNNAGNWAGALPVDGDVLLLGHWGAGALGNKQPIVNSASAFSPVQLGIGWTSSAASVEMTVAAGGSLTAGSIYVNHGSPVGVDATLHITGGSLTASGNMIVGGNGGQNALVDMTGGVLNAGVLFIDNGNASLSGTVNLAGGTINAGALSVGVNGVMDITGGTLVWGTNMEGLTGMSSWGNAPGNTWVTAYGGAGTFVASWDGTNTTVTAVPEPATMLLLGLGGLVLRRKRA